MRLVASETSGLPQSGTPAVTASPIPSIDELQQVLWQIIGVMSKEIVPVIKDSLLIQKRIPRTRVSKAKLQRLAQELHIQFTNFSH